MALTNIQKVRYELADTDVSFPLLNDTEYEYFLEKNNDSIQRTAIDCAKTILFKLSVRSDETVDLFSIKGSQAAKSYIQALKLYIKDPSLNRLFDNLQPYAGGISKSDMLANDANLDNNRIVPPAEALLEVPILNYQG